MRKPSIILGFSRYNNGKLAVKVRYILSRMTGNPHFPNPTPTLAEVEARADAYDAAFQGLDGTEAGRLLFAQERKVLEGKLRFLGLYVLHNGNDDPVILESSGFDLAKTPEAHTADELEPQNFKATPGGPRGKMTVECDPVNGAKSYNFQYRVNAEGAEWISISNSRSVVVLEGLTPGVEYAFRLCVVGTRGHQVFSQTILRHAS